MASHRSGTKDADVSINGDLLVLKGEKRQATEEKEENCYPAERSYGAFQRSFVLSDGIDREEIAAEFPKDVPTLTLSKTPDAQKQQKKIEVKAYKSRRRWLDDRRLSPFSNSRRSPPT